LVLIRDFLRLSRADRSPPPLQSRVPVHCPRRVFLPVDGCGGWCLAVVGLSFFLLCPPFWVVVLSLEFPVREAPRRPDPCALPCLIEITRAVTSRAVDVLLMPRAWRCKAVSDERYWNTGWNAGRVLSFRQRLVRAFGLVSVGGGRCWLSLVAVVDPLVFSLYSLPSVTPPLAGTGVPFPVGTAWRWG